MTQAKEEFFSQLLKHINTSPLSNFHFCYFQPHLLTTLSGLIIGTVCQNAPKPKIVRIVVISIKSLHNQRIVQDVFLTSSSPVLVNVTTFTLKCSLHWMKQHLCKSGCTGYIVHCTLYPIPIIFSLARELQQSGCTWYMVPCTQYPSIFSLAREQAEKVAICNVVQTASSLLPSS